MAERELLVRIVGDDKDLQRALSSTDKRLTAIDSRSQKFGRNLGRAFAAAGIAIGAREVFQAANAAIQAASDLNEEISKSRQIFGDSSAAIEAWAQTTAGAIGVSRSEALAATGTFGNLFKAVEIGQKDAADMSQQFVTLAADMASFNNADISDVLLAIRSGLVGEAEPLRRYGVLLSEARVQQVAMAATGKENVKELTNQEKAMARYEIILSDTAVAQGDFVRTSDGLANQTRVLQAQMSDLQAELGSKLLPTMLRLTSAAVGLVDAFTQAGDSLDPRLGQTLVDVDISALTEMRNRLAEIKGEGDDVVAILNEIISRLQAVQGVLVGGPDSRAGLRGPGGIAASNAVVDERNRTKNLARQKKEQERAAKQFDEFVKGLGLKLDKAGLTATLSDDLAVLREIERGIQRRIAAEGRTFELVEKLTEVRNKINTTVKQQAEEAQQASEDAYQAVIDALNLKLDKAGVTKSLQDDLAVLEDIESRIRQRIRAEGETSELLAELFRVQQKQADLRKDIADNTRKRQQGRQFEELGLTAEGDKRVPGAGALRTRLGNIEQAVAGTFLDTPKTAATLERISEVLSGKFGKIGKDVRQAILQMFNDISSALEEGGKKGPLTKFQKRGIGDLVEGLGLSEEETKALRQRFAQLGAGGTAPGKGIGAFGFTFQPGTGSTFGTPNQRNVEEFHIYIDGEEVESRVTKRQQRKNGRTAKQRRGTRPGI